MLPSLESLVVTATGVMSKGRSSGLGLEGINNLLCGVQELEAHRGANAGLPIGVWGAPLPSLTSSGVGVPPVVVPPVVSVVSNPLPASQVGLPAGSSDDVRLADVAKGEVYVCFEDPLGAHLKSDFRERIWKGKSVEIFSLFPLEKCNLNRVKPDESKKKEKERRRYRLILRTFPNWLQAFSILASVIGEKAPENCPMLFCYLDLIGEAPPFCGIIKTSAFGCAL